MEGKLVEQTRMRAGIARRMTESKQQAPHFYVQTEVAVEGVRERLAELKGDGPRRSSATEAAGPATRLQGPCPGSNA